MAADPTPAAGTGRLILLLGIAAFAGALNGRVTDPFVASIAVEFQVPERDVALLASAYAIPFALIQPILGPIGDALGKRRIIPWALLALAVVTLLSPLSQGLGALLVFRALTGLCAGGIMPLTLASTADAVPVAGRQVALSRLLVFSIGGGIAGGALAGVLSPLMGWRGLMVLTGLVALVAAIVLLIRGIGGPPEIPVRFDAVRAARRYRAILGLPAARLLYAAVLIEGLLIFGSFPWFAPLLEAAGAGGAEEAGLAVAGFGAGGFVYAALAGPILKRLGQRRMVRLGGVLAGLALCGIGLVPGAAGFIAAGLVLGTGFYMVHNSIQTRVSEVAPEARGSAMALHSFHFFLGQSLGPLLMGFGIAGLGGFGAMALAAAGILALALVLARQPRVS